MTTQTVVTNVTAEDWPSCSQCGVEVDQATADQGGLCEDCAAGRPEWWR
ncbi:MAG: hypothetical protein K1X95_06635 [Acidimicrobiia bacterium]|nr:hypothetical protein [Acidimicrobiia bacterium]